MFFLGMLTYLVTLQSSSQSLTLKVQVPETRKEREIGLSHTSFLPKKEGMLFLFEKEGFFAFTMKNTPIPLSLLFFNHEKELIEIQTFPPFDPTPIHPTNKCQYVLEVNPDLLKTDPLSLNSTKLLF